MLRAKILSLSLSLSLFVISTAWCLSAAKPASAATDLSSFSVIQYFDDPAQPGAGNWVLSAGNTAVTQTVNNDPSMFLSPFTVSNVTVDFDVYISSGDDDTWGFAWGWQDLGDWYGFQWTNNNSTTSIFKVNDGPVDPFCCSTNNETFDAATNVWPNNTLMHVNLDYTPTGSVFEVTVGGIPVSTFSFTDSVFTSGRLGFWTYSQDSVTFSNLEIVPEPSTGALTLGGLLLLHLQRRRARGSARMT
jgi:hypothetical protein